MGSLFKTSMPSYVPVSYNPISKSVPEIQENEKIDEVKKSEEEDKIKNAVRKSARGRNSTIQTSYRGILTTGKNSLSPQRKNLLGE